jgi:pimeloyl-ACP methyl ester carboxylesterase/DNA-binding CsgD family transcriptional regulator
MQQDIRFCAAADGVRLAYATYGSGPVLVKAAHWLTHLEYDWRSPVWRHWLEALGVGHRVVRYDGRGCGLSDRSPAVVTLDAAVADLAAVVDSAGLDTFALLGSSQGGPVAIAYALRYPDRLTHLILCGAYARGRLVRAASAEEREEADLLQSLVRVGWGRQDPVFRRVFTARFLPGGTPEQMDSFDELQRLSASAEMAQRLREVWMRIDVVGQLGGVEAPTLVAHARDDAIVPFEEGRLLAARIPHARFLPLDSRNHILLPQEPAWATFVSGLGAFLGTEPVRAPGDAEQLSAREAADQLSSREAEVLRLVAAGLANDEIAQRLSVSVRTVERHLSNSYDKLGVAGRSARAAAAAWITQVGQRSPSGGPA